MRNEDRDNPALRLARAGKLAADEQRQAIEEAGAGYYYSAHQAFDDKLKKWVIEEALLHLRPGRVLDLGYINDIWTQALLARSGVTGVDIVEAAASHVERAREDLKGVERVRIFPCLFEDFQPDATYDTILMSGVVKHVPDDAAFVRRAREWLSPGGVVLASTPNCRAFHRRLGTYMGLELSPCLHNERDESVFNVHIYDRFSWQALFLANGYRVRHVKGIGMKPFGTSEMLHLAERYDIDRILDGLRRMAEELPDYAWYLLLVAERDGSR
jgi:2-polyprenyl-3-methyl-5-hydroxy-6-metoxy-1,4-benzoquinol methylase